MKIVIESPEKFTDSDLEELCLITLTAHALCHALININNEF